MTLLTTITTWLTRGKAAQAKTEQIVGAYAHWLATEHPHFWDAHGATLLAGITPANLAERIAAADRLVARYAAA